jgi:hypothetical protein
LTSLADAALTAGPWSVMQKSKIAPSGDKHDYLSIAPYYWGTQPITTANPYGCPMIRKDGVRNPAAAVGTDWAARAAAWPAIYNLALAWYYTGNSAYAQRAELDMRTWFLDPATAMNPQLPYSQIIPCVTKSGSGIIDSSEIFGLVVDAAGILDSGAPGWTSTDTQAMHTWVGKYLTWMTTSPDGISNQASTDNTGSFQAAQDAAMAYYLGQTSQAMTLVQLGEKRVDLYISASGQQPYEMARTRPWHYSLFNLTALCRLAGTARHLNVNLWTYVGSGGGSMNKAVEFLAPYAAGKATWSFPDLDSPIPLDAAYPVIHAAATYGNDAIAQNALPNVPRSANGQLWELEPVCIDL